LQKVEINYIVEFFEKRRDKVMKKGIVILLLSCLLVGCGAIKGLEASANRNQLDKLKVGMTTDQVRRAMGRPYKSEFYGTKQMWFYITDWQSDGKTTPDEMTPLVFENDILLGWGSKFLARSSRKRSWW
jgi:outer membrane protein assembly factor BamE (lipoprotein component of BamABCDE complex)